MEADYQENVAVSAERMHQDLRDDTRSKVEQRV
jgi:hypothetical protein